MAANPDTRARSFQLARNCTVLARVADEYVELEGLLHDVRDHVSPSRG
jgi:hypothetical protein